MSVGRATGLLGLVRSVGVDMPGPFSRAVE